MSLYQKYRPNDFSKVKGNEDVLVALEKMVSNIETCPHAILITGPSGTGKTTVGRIIATRLGCVGSDYKEVDSGQFRGIDTIREIRSNAQYAAMEGPVRVWLLDEAHKMTGDAMSALLKVLEDAPSHVFFILCTTDPQKLLPTIRSRCSTFQMQPLQDSVMVGLLRRIAKREGEQVEDEILQQIASDSLGQSRNAIQVLEQVINTPAERRLEVAKRAAEQQSKGIELCNALINRKPWKMVAGILVSLKEQDNDAESVRRMVLGYCQACLFKGATNNQIAHVMECFMDNTYDSGFPAITYAAYSSLIQE